MKQPTAAPIVAAGAAATGLGALIFALFSIGDCLRYQSGPGQCNDVVKDNAMVLAMGILGIAGPVGGYFTLNPKLGSVDQRDLKRVASAIGQGALAGAAGAELERIATSRLGLDGSVDVERVLMLHARGLANKHIARAVGADERDVEAALHANEDIEPGL